MVETEGSGTISYISMDKLYIGKKSPLIKSSNHFLKKFESDQVLHLDACPIL